MPMVTNKAAKYTSSTKHFAIILDKKKPLHIGAAFFCCANNTTHNTYTHSPCSDTP